MSILTEYSLWFVPLCLLLGAAYAVFLYLRNRDIDYDKRARWIMPILRGLAISLIAFLLLSPLLKHNVKEVDRPLLLVAVDNSESMVSTGDSAYYRTEFPKQLQKLIEDFGDKYDIKTYLVGEQNDLQEGAMPKAVPFSGKTTNLSSLFDEVDNLYANHNIGAMVLVSDGIFNTGSNPQYAAERAKYPIYTVAAGDTSVQTDLLVTDILHNRQTYLGKPKMFHVKQPKQK